MRAYRRASKPADSPTTEAALAAMDAEELRDLIREMIPWLDESTHARLVNALVDLAARSRSGWVPPGPTNDAVGEILHFAKAAKRVGYADPSEVDDYLRQGSNAFLGKDYRSAYQIFRALLVPIGNADVDLGQHETFDEVLGIDVAACAAQYVVSTYMTATPSDRGKAVHSAIDEVRGIGHFWEPMREMERAAVEPLPELGEFLAQWRALVEERADGGRESDWDSDEDRWRREVVERMEGADGLAKLARITKRASDLRAWCRVLVEAGDWKTVLAAYEESAEVVTDKKLWRGDFLDGAALAAQELGRKDLPERLERAWRDAPDMLRLRRWLGSSKNKGSKGTLRRRAAEALDACPKRAHRQRALLHVLLGDLESAAQLLANARGLGWSDAEHPGYLLFPFFCSLLGSVELSTERSRDFNELSLPSAGGEPRLLTPEVSELLEMANVGATTDGKTRAAVLNAMRMAAAKRIEGVTENKRRGHYGHAAALALACVQVDGSPESATWLSAIRDEYRRYPALQRELGRRSERR